MDNWINIFNSTDKFDVELIKAHLESEFGILSVIKDHQDSMYKSLNDADYSAQLYVRPEDKEKALEYINSREKS